MVTFVPDPLLEVSGRVETVNKGFGTGVAPSLPVQLGLYRVHLEWKDRGLDGKESTGVESLSVRVEGSMGSVFILVVTEG